jgi:hypothetical protein
MNLKRWNVAGRVASHEHSCAKIRQIRGNWSLGPYLVLCGVSRGSKTQSPSPPQQAQPSPPQQAPSITDQKFEQTAAAIKRVVSVKEDYQQRIAAAAASDKEPIAEEGGEGTREGGYRSRPFGRGICGHPGGGAEGSRRPPETQAAHGFFG